MEYIKIIATGVLRIILRVFYIFPIRKNRVVFNSYMGRQYSCNPKYISEYLLEHFQGRFEVIWCFEEPEKYAFLLEKDVRLCKLRSLRFYYYRLTARVSISNASAGAEIPKRKGQYVINTWHGGGGGYKRIGTGVKQHQGVNAIRNSREKSEVDLFCASSETSLRNTIRGSFHHEGDCLRGTPRNDMFINLNRPEIRKEVCSFLGQLETIRFALYAPTFRETGDLAKDTHDYGIDFQTLYNALKQRFGGTWVIALRYHFLLDHYTVPPLPYVVDATKYSDMQDLLYAADALITDYSSSIWDYSFTNRPCFLFCSDLKDYEASRGFNKPIREWGFPVSETNEQLREQILTWDPQEHAENMRRHHEENGSFEDGTATARICEIIREKCGVT